jgi:hypothetical protein
LSNFVGGKKIGKKGRQNSTREQESQTMSAEGAFAGVGVSEFELVPRCEEDVWACAKCWLLILVSSSNCGPDRQHLLQYDLTWGHYLGPLPGARPGSYSADNALLWRWLLDDGTDTILTYDFFPFLL